MDIDLIVGSMMGAAEYVADELEQNLMDKHQVTQHLDADLKELTTDGSHIWLVCTSTHGAGDFPDNIQPFVDQLEAKSPDLSKVKYGIIALGSSQYDTYCQAGRHMDKLLSKLGATRIGDRLEIDAEEQPVPEDAALEWLPGWRNVLEAQ